jgi:hypothetical protein
MIDVSVAGHSVADVALPEANLGIVTVTVEPGLAVHSRHSGSKTETPPFGGA